VAVSFNYGILDDVAHRPWPLPERPWMMTQTWHDLLFAHWPVDRALLAPKIPRGLELDLHDGQAWLGVVPFRMSHVAPRGVPAIRRLSAFPELNVRTYVRAAGAPGVYFFSLDAAHLEAVMIARTLLHLPYRLAAMSVEDDGSRICYRSRRTSFSAPAAFTATYAPTGPACSAKPSSLDYFLTERYCLYTVRGRGEPRRLDIHHQPWPLQPATATFECNTMADAIGVALPSSAPVLHFARRLDVLAWSPRPVESRGDSM
jgi:hypothetical protein